MQRNGIHFYTVVLANTEKTIPPSLKFVASLPCSLQKGGFARRCIEHQITSDVVVRNSGIGLRIDRIVNLMIRLLYQRIPEYDGTITLIFQI